MKLGIQLYSVLNEFKKNERQTMEALANMGYQGIEFAFSFGTQPPDQLADDLRRLNMAPISFYSSYPLEALLNPGHEMFARAKALEMKYITVGSGSFVRNDWQGTIRKVAEIAGIAGTHGLTLNYHNHSEEFERIGGRHALALLAEQTSPDLVKIELDTHFAMKAGENPLQWIERFSGRMPLLHIKDINLKDKSEAPRENLHSPNHTAKAGIGTKEGVIEVGDGDLDIENVWKTAKKCGVQWIIVEFHNIAARQPLESAQRCVSNLIQRGLINRK